MAEDWQLIRDLMGGTRTMRAAGEDWLPQELSEEEDTTGALYEARLNRTILFNGLRRSIDSMTGTVFRTPLTLADNTPEQLVEWSKDIDLQGHDIGTFSRKVFRDALSVGMSHIYVDYPRGSDDSKTKADDKATGSRPYWIHVPAERLIGWRSENRDGRQVLTEARIRETVMEPDGEWGEKAVSQVRVLRPGNFVVYRQSGKTWDQFEEGETSLDYIPLVTIYTGQTGFMAAEPPLMDLAWLNSMHWQSSSDQRHILHAARVPILSFMGFSDEECKSVTIGPLTGIRSTNTDSKVEFVEHSGAAIDAGRQDLIDLKDEMAVMGLDLLVRKQTGNRTATEIAVKAAQAESALGAAAQSFKDGLETAYKFTSDYVGISDDTTVALDAALNLPTIDEADLKLLWEMRSAGEMSRETFYAELRRRGRIDEDVTAESETKRLGEEKRVITPLTRLPLGDAVNA